jgi:hypothetical protein
MSQPYLDHLEDSNVQIIFNSLRPSITGHIRPQEPIAMEPLLAAGPSPSKVTERFVTGSKNTHLSLHCLVAMLAVALLAEFDEAVRRILGVLPAPGIVGVLSAVVGIDRGCKCGCESGHVGKGGHHAVDGWLLVHVRRAVNRL